MGAFSRRRVCLCTMVGGTVTTLCRTGSAKVTSLRLIAVIIASRRREGLLRNMHVLGWWSTIIMGGGLCSLGGGRRRCVRPPFFACCTSTVGSPGANGGFWRDMFIPQQALTIRRRVGFYTMSG